MQRFRAWRKRPSEIQRLRSTSSRCISEIWPAGPPKLMNPSFTQKRNASLNPTLFPPDAEPAVALIAAGCRRQKVDCS